jgi:lysophospholipase L1-like esterase
LVSNSVGLREDHEISLIRAEREVRVLFVGGSVTFGFMALPEDTIPHFLEQALQDRLPDRKVESINAGTPGYSLFQGWRFLLAEGFDYSPDVIVLQFGLNEGETWDDLGDRLHHQAWVEAQPFEPLRWSRVFHLLWKLRSIDSADRDPDLEPEPKPRPRILPDEYVELLREINKETERRGIELLLFVAPNALNLNMEFPWRRTKYQQATLDYGPMVMFGPEYRPGLVDGIPVAQKLRRDHPLHDLLFEDGVHVRPMLAKALAEQLADKIAPVFESE